MHRKLQVCRHVGPQKGWWWMGEPGRPAKGGRPWAESQGKERTLPDPCVFLIGFDIHLLCPECLAQKCSLTCWSTDFPQPHQRDLFCWDSKTYQFFLLLWTFGPLFRLCEMPFLRSSQLSFAIRLWQNFLWEGSFWPLSPTWWTYFEWMKEWIRVWHVGLWNFAFLGSQAPAMHVFNILFTLLVKVLGSHPFPRPLHPGQASKNGKGWFPGSFPSALQPWGPGEMYQLWTDLLDQQL